MAVVLAITGFSFSNNPVEETIEEEDVKVQGDVIMPTKVLVQAVKRLIDVTSHLKLLLKKENR